MTEHTPTPWKIDGDTIYDQDDNSICVFLDEWEVCRNDEANARHIVRCVNSHDALVKALEEVFDAYVSFTDEHYCVDILLRERVSRALAAAKEEKEG